MRRDGKKLALVGTIKFDVENLTKKHRSQSSWKRVAVIQLDGDICEYYAWYINKRYNIKLSTPLRGPHITIINDSNRDMMEMGGKTEEDVDELWLQIKDKYDGKKIPIMLDLNVRISDDYWWFRIHHNYKDKFNAIRKELNLGKPYFDYHMTVGYPYKKYIEHNKYIHQLFKTKLIK